MQAYFDWQVTTIMLARDVVDPLDGDEHDAEARRKEIENEVARMTIALVPDVYKNDPELGWPPELMRQITQATLRRAAEIAGG